MYNMKLYLIAVHEIMKNNIKCAVTIVAYKYMNNVQKLDKEGECYNQFIDSFKGTSYLL